MFRYILVLLLLNTCYRSLGNPIPTKANTSNLAISMTALANSCKNEFLSNQIKGKINDCSVSIVSHGDKIQLSSHHLECLMFYDINNQLCSAANATKLQLTGDYTAKLREEQNVNTLCNMVKDWNFSNLTEYPDYQPDKLLKHLVTCGNICGVDEVISSYANYYCKYFNWGTEMLKSQVSTSQVSINNNGVAPMLPDGVNTYEASAVTTNSSTVQMSTFKTNETVLRNPTMNKPPVISSSVNNDVIPDITLQDTSSNQQSSDTAIVEKPEHSDDSDVYVNKVEPSAVRETGMSGNGQLNKTVAEETSQKQDAEKDVAQPEEGNDLLLSKIEKGAEVPKVGNNAPLPKLETDLLNNKPETKEPIIEKPLSDNDDYPDSDEGKDEIIGVQGGDDGGDPILDDVGVQAEREQSIIPIKKTEPIVPSLTGDMSQKEYYPNTIPEEEDDHFFQFFLTTVILVILLYVLYHNKSKVSKVFLGLLVEGRQPGRRRNSRGHAYRRLDTLEQAMSANTAAPPSKIIY